MYFSSSKAHKLNYSGLKLYVIRIWKLVTTILKENLRSLLRKEQWVSEWLSWTAFGGKQWGVHTRKFAHQGFKDLNTCHFNEFNSISCMNIPHIHYGDVIMDVLASQITSLAIVFSTVHSGADQRKHQSSASLAFVRGIHRRPVNSPHKWPVTRKMFPFDYVIMNWEFQLHIYIYICSWGPNRSLDNHSVDGLE